jgi:imidazolonepropionase-like amidohydrolase
MVDAHAHLFSSGACTPGVGAGIGQAVRNLHALMRGGVTTVADLGAPALQAVALRRYVGTARGRGPRLLVSGPPITAPGGAPTDPDGTGDHAAVSEVPSVFAARNAVRDIADADVDLIELGLLESGDDGEMLPMLEGEALCAAVDEAHRQEMRAVAYATTARAYSAALGCGADAIVHGSLELLPADLVAGLAEARVPVAPGQLAHEARLWGPEHVGLLDEPRIRELLSDETLDDLEKYAADDGESPLPSIDRTRAEATVAALAENTKRMASAGVPLALGTGAASCSHPAGSPIGELERFEQAGIDRLEVLRIASLGGARLLNLQDALGRAAVGFRADLIGVRGKPDQRLADVTAVELVVIDGVEQALDGPTLGQHLAAGVQIGWARLTD